MLLVFAPEWLDYPGLELWKFGNLAIFTTLAILALRRPVGAALVARREAIRRELIKAETERKEASAKLEEAEALEARLESDVKAVQEQAKSEAEAERHRLAIATQQEMEKLRTQAQREIEIADKVARKTLRQFLAHRSVELARETIVGQISADDDSRLIGKNVGELRGTRV